MLIRFLGTRQGNVAMMFGLLLVPLLVGAGIGFDMMRASNIRTQLNEAADAGLLAAARAKASDPGLTNAQAMAIARRYFDANSVITSSVIIDSFDFSPSPDGAGFTVNVTGSIKTTILGAVGQKTVPVSIYSVANLAPSRALEIALVLDNTWSMTGAKLTALKAAATDLVDVIMEDTNNTVKVGLVPFSQYVNIGLSRRNATWLDVPDDYSVVTPNVCSNTYPDRTDTNCVTTNETCTSTRDGVTTTSACTQTSCDTDYGDPVQVCSDQTSNYTWRGCVGSRDHPFNVEDRDYAVRPITGLMNLYCSRELTPLTLTKASIVAEIDAMAVQGSYTYIPAGMVWGYRLLSSVDPFSEGITYAQMATDDAVKALVLMTDGANTRSSSYPYHNDSGAADANQILDELCIEAKRNDIKIYTIAFEVSDVTIRMLLEDCATSSDTYFNATDAAALADAFQAIGASLQELALTR